MARRLSSAFLIVCISCTVGCVKREDECRINSDCEEGVCLGSGFCESECAGDVDCPHGSFCANGCEVCIRNDLMGPATCFAHNRDVSHLAVLGACRGDLDERTASMPSAPAPLCGADAGPVDAGSSDGGSSDGGSSDAGPDDGGSIDAQTEDAGQSDQGADAGQDASSSDSGGLDEGVVPQDGAVDGGAP